MSEKKRDNGIKGLTTDMLSGRVPPVLPGQMKLDLERDLGPTVNIKDGALLCTGKTRESTVDDNKARVACLDRAEFLPDWHESTVNPDFEASRVFIKPSDEPAYRRRQTTAYGGVDAQAFNAFLSEGELAVSYFSAYDGRQGAIQANCYSGEECPMSAIIHEKDGSVTTLNDVELEPLKTTMICTIVSKSGIVFIGSSQAEPWGPVNLDWLRKQAYNEAFSKYKAASMFYFQHEVYQQVLLDKQMAAMCEEGERRFEAQTQKDDQDVV